MVRKEKGQAGGSVAASASTPAPRSRRGIIVAGLVVALVLVGLALVGRARLRPHGRPNVLLITIDTLRADHLGCYGDKDAATPVLDALAARGARFPTAVSHAPNTLPSHASILTALVPPRHGIRDNARYALPAHIKTAADWFRAQGYATAAFVSGFPLLKHFGLAPGFDAYDDRLVRGTDPGNAVYSERPADATTSAVLGWLGARAADPKPFFLWVHYFDPHQPYVPPPPFAERFASKPYDGEIAFTDAQIGTLLSRLDEMGVTSNTVVLVTADHGESLGEHGEETHGFFVYDSTLRVPWIVAGPGITAGATPAAVARGVDVAPTLADLAGVPVPSGLDGRSLKPALLGHALPDAPTYAETLTPMLDLGWAPLYAWRTAQWKYIQAPRPELYALDADAREATDRTAEHPDVVRTLSDHLQAVLKQKAPDASVAVSAETAERLQSLGYLSATKPAQAKAGPQKEPKDGIALIVRLERDMGRARQDPKGAIEDLSAILADAPEINLAYRYRAIARSTLGEHAKAAEDLLVLEKSGTASVKDVAMLGECLWNSGQKQAGVAALERASALDPSNPDPLLSLGQAYAGLGRRAEAEAIYKKILSLSPGHAEALKSLGDLARSGGDAAAATKRYAQAAQADPGNSEAAIALAVSQARAGREDEAIRLLQDVVARDPTNVHALIALGGLQGKGGRPAEAAGYYQRAVNAGARTKPALNGLGFARWQAGDMQGALAALRSSLAVDPQQPDIRAAISEISHGHPAPR